ncbi:MAG TPA: glutamate racemase [Thermoflexales bacterium]|nr:glutamate racemase [Thermoflexales bacterium]
MIGIFDTGLGGLSVWRALATALPNRTMLYLADQARAPYGPRQLSAVRALTLGCLAWLIEQGCRTVVLACNTATAAAADEARALWPHISVVGIEPAVKPAAQATRTGVIGVLATQATFESPRYMSLTRRYAAEVRVLPRACPHWVALVEDGPGQRADTSAMVDAEIEPLLDAGADQIVLGCTHFPLLMPWIEAAVVRWRTLRGVDRAIQVLDPAPAVARQAARVEQLGASVLAGDQFWTTGDPRRFAIRAAEALGDDWKFGQCRLLPLSALSPADL